MADPKHKPENKFFLVLEESPQHAGQRIFFRTHVPRMLTLEDARTLAQDLLNLAGPGPVETETVTLALVEAPEPEPELVPEA